jgi:N-methylhydantoinase B
MEVSNMDQNNKLKVDAVTVEIVGNLMLSIAEETSLSIIKSAYSTNIKERRDVSSAVVDPDGDMVAQADNLPIHLSAFLTFVKGLYQVHPPETIRPGDLFIGNDPYHGGGNHLPDLILAEPVFGGAKLIGWIVNMAHHSDIGGKVPGSTSSDADSIFQEGLRIPIIRICQDGKVLDDVLNFILANTRVRTERQGDLIAQIASNHVGARRMRESYEKYGDGLLECMKELQNYSERRLKAAIAKIPDGVYTYTDYMDDAYPSSSEPLKIAVTITVKGDFIEFDFSDTCDQVEAPLNVSYNSLLATVFYSLKVLFGADIPATSGIYRAFRVIARQGSIVDPVEPAPFGGTINTCQRLPDVIFGALASVAPERVVAGCNSTCQTTVFTSQDPENPRNLLICHEAIGGGSGASKHADGLSGVQVHMTNTSNMPIEALETEFPTITIKKYELRQDSGGAGNYRGGLGIDREFEMMVEGIRLKATGDRQKFHPWGLDGGGEGATGAFYRCFNGKETKLPSKNTGLPMQKGEIVKALTPGAGGYGDPRKRPPEKVLADVANGYVSLEKARELYRVWIVCGAKGLFTLDEAMTRQLREQGDD